LKNKKVFLFTTEDIETVIAANNAKEAIDYYINYYQDDIYLNDQVLNGLGIRELWDIEITTDRLIYNENEKSAKFTSYRELLEKHKDIDKPILLAFKGYYV